LLSLLLIWIYVYRLMGKKARRLYYVRGRRMDYTVNAAVNADNGPPLVYIYIYIYIYIYTSKNHNTG
jgi:Na+-transporting methylmalonyl-CoA/oxaloacetate decarboxylase gamma subunit